MSDAEIKSQVDLLVQAGAVAPADREQAERVLWARSRIHDIRFSATERRLDEAADALDAARRQADEAIGAIRAECLRWRGILDDVTPLDADPRCQPALLRLRDTLEQFELHCKAIPSPSDGPPGELLKQHQVPWAAGLRDLQKIVDNG